MSEEVTLKEWLDGIYEVLKESLISSDPVGDDDTGWLVKIEYDNLTISEVSEKLTSKLPDDKQYLCYLLAATLMHYAVERAAQEARNG